MMRRFFLLTVVSLASVNAQAPQQGPVVVSPEVTAERKVIFRLLAPKAESVGLQASDIPGTAKPPVQFVKAENGVWEAAVGPVDPGTYRYRFMVNGVAVVDPRNPAVSESNNNAWSVVHIPGASFMDFDPKIAHGAVAEAHYYSTALSKQRRMHVYTPPGYELGKGKYPVFYLLHGASDCDDSWTSVGRAGFILDNLIAAGKARPMIVVMPAGHTSTSPGPGRGMSSAMEDFTGEFAKDILPYVEKNYRVLTGRKDRAIAGLSMGGMQTLNIAMAQLDKFAYVGVYSSGVFGTGPRPPAAPGAAAPAGPAPAPEWEQKNKAALDDANLKKGLKLFWFATGKEDFLLKTTLTTVEMLKKHGFTVEYEETGGGHTWINWRNYLNVFAPRLFQ